MRLLITDLDNTLYDWVTFFARSFRAMSSKLSEILDIEESALAREFKAVHQRHGTLEAPFAALELPIVLSRFPNHSRSEIARELAEAFAAFDTTRRETLKLYDSVRETLHALTDGGVIVVGHTEAVAINAYYRVAVLDVVQYFRRLYTLEGRVQEHPNPDRPRRLAEPPPGFLRILPVTERKPNPALLLDICRCEGVAPGEAYYVGDSIVRDVAMAKAAGVKAVWARFGTEYEKGLWETLVTVTHWTDEDVKREVELRAQFATVAPDVVIDSFSELLPLFGLPSSKPHTATA
jgi:phosphoglycolate phosphatase-like HAD superfamily hydrolase